MEPRTCFTVTSVAPSMQTYFRMYIGASLTNREQGRATAEVHHKVRSKKVRGAAARERPGMRPVRAPFLALSRPPSLFVKIGGAITIP
jgi:hypothetical protein